MANGVDFYALWVSFKNSAELSNNHRIKAVLLNHEQNPEYILRKLGVVSYADIERISNEFKKRPRKLHE